MSCTVSTRFTDTLPAASVATISMPFTPGASVGTASKRPAAEPRRRRRSPSPPPRPRPPPASSSHACAVAAGGGTSSTISGAIASCSAANSAAPATPPSGPAISSRHAAPAADAGSVTWNAPPSADQRLHRPRPLAGPTARSAAPGGASEVPLTSISPVRVSSRPSASRGAAGSSGSSPRRRADRRSCASARSGCPPVDRGDDDGVRSRGRRQRGPESPPSPTGTGAPFRSAAHRARSRP